jgi:hypothetical protein
MSRLYCDVVRRALHYCHSGALHVGLAQPCSRPIGLGDRPRRCDNAGRWGLRAFPGIQSTITELQAAARTLDLQLVVVNARTDSDFETAFASFSQQHVGAVLVGIGTIFNRRTEQLAALAARHALPAMFPYREFALAGGLMS